MFEKLADFFEGWFEDLKVFEIITQYEAGVHLRKGKYYRILKPGIRWKVPVIDEFVTETTTVTTMDLPTQTIDKLVVAAIIRYRIKNIKPFVLKVWEAEDVLRDVTMGEIRRAVQSTSSPEEAEKLILQNTREAVKEYGIHVFNVTFTDYGNIRSIRLIQE